MVFSWFCYNDFAMNYDYKKLKIWAIPLYFISQVLLVLVLFLVKSKQFKKMVWNRKYWLSTIGIVKLTLIFLGLVNIDIVIEKS